MFMNPKIVIIGAVSQDGVYGIDGEIPWRLKGDFAHFRTTTMGYAVVMGRETWLSLPVKFRPLPERINIVVSSHDDFDGAALVKVVRSLSEAIGVCSAEKLFVIGGARMWMEALPLATEAWVTVVEKEFAGVEGGILYCPELLSPSLCNPRLVLNAPVRPESEADTSGQMLAYKIHHWESSTMCSPE
jgi:dihydrofolate reductase